jgi:hypothetical protein
MKFETYFMPHSERLRWTRKQRYVVNTALWALTLHKRKKG